MGVQKETKKRTQKVDWLCIVIVLTMVGFLFFVWMESEPVYIGSYSVASPIEVKSFEVGTQFMHQTIAFQDKDGNDVVLENVFFGGDTHAETVYLWRIGAFEWLSHFRDGYRFFVTDDSQFYNKK